MQTISLTTVVLNRKNGESLTQIALKMAKPAAVAFKSCLKNKNLKKTIIYSVLHTCSRNACSYVYFNLDFRLWTNKLFF